jgi:hypothetical protein
MAREGAVLQKIHGLLPDFEMEKGRAEVDKRASPTSTGEKMHQPLDVCSIQECE